MFVQSSQLVPALASLAANLNFSSRLRGFAGFGFGLVAATAGLAAGFGFAATGFLGAGGGLSILS